MGSDGGPELSRVFRRRFLDQLTRHRAERSGRRYFVSVYVYGSFWLLENELSSQEIQWLTSYAHVLERRSAWCLDEEHLCHQPKHRSIVARGA